MIWCDPDPTRGREQAKRRPFVIVSVDQLNSSPAELSLAVPLTRSQLRNPLHLGIDPPHGGLEVRSFALPEQLRSISHSRLDRRIGRLPNEVLAELLHRCRILLTTPG